MACARRCSGRRIAMAGSPVATPRGYLPTIMDPIYGYEAVNVEAQSRSLASLLSWTKRLISVRKSSKVFGHGLLTFTRPTNRSVLVYVRQYEISGGANGRDQRVSAHPPRRPAIPAV